MRSVLLCSLLALGIGCGDPSTPSSDGGRDANAVADASSDASFDAGHDARRDAGRDAGHDAGRDSGVNAGHDAGHDAGFDAGYDAGYDGGFDAGPSCECASGACCDGCHYRLATFVCGNDIPTNAVCQGTIRYSPTSAATCSGYDSIAFDVADRYCSGVSAACNGSIVQTGTSKSGGCATTDGDGLPQDPENRILCQPAPGDVAGNRCVRCF